MALGITLPVAVMTPPSAHVGQQEGFAAREDIEALGLKLLQHRCSIVPNSRAVLHAGNCAGASLEQPLDER